MFAIDRRSQTESTNDDAAALLGDPAFAGTAIVADFQRAGRGRRERAWIAPPGGSLLFTAILPQPIPTASLWAATLWTALCVADGIEIACGVRAALQWPNDLLLGARKCCGILNVSRVAGDVAWIGCGVGLNVLRPSDDAARASLATVVPPPAFLSDHTATSTDGAPLERDLVLHAILATLETRAPELERPHAIARAWERRAALAGTRYRLLVDGEREAFEAVAKRLAPDGGLVIERDGNEETISLADARVLRDGTVSDVAGP